MSQASRTIRLRSACSRSSAQSSTSLSWRPIVSSRRRVKTRWRTSGGALRSIVLPGPSPQPRSSESGAGSRSIPSRARWPARSLALNGLPQVADAAQAVQDVLVEGVAVGCAEPDGHRAPAKKKKCSVAPRTGRVPTSSSRPPPPALEVVADERQAVPALEDVLEVGWPKRPADPGQRFDDLHLRRGGRPRRRAAPNRRGTARLAQPTCTPLGRERRAFVCGGVGGISCMGDLLDPAAGVASGRE